MELYFEGVDENEEDDYQMVEIDATEVVDDFLEDN